MSRAEINQLKMKAGQVTDDSLDSTKRMVALIDESREAGIHTLVELDKRGDQLYRIDDRLNQIHSDIDSARKNLSGIEKCCGLCVLPCNKSSVKEDEKMWTEDSDDKVVDNQPQRMKDVGPVYSAAKGGYVAKITNDAREEEMDENLKLVHTGIGNLRSMALDIQSELIHQDHLINKISNKADLNQEMVKEANKKTRHIMKNQ